MPSINSIIFIRKNYLNINQSYQLNRNKFTLSQHSFYFWIQRITKKIHFSVSKFRASQAYDLAQMAHAPPARMKQEEQRRTYFFVSRIERDRMLRCFATFYRLKINVSKLCHAFVSEGDTSWTLSNDRTERTADNSIARQILVTRQVTKFSSFPLHLPTSLV